MSDSAAFIPVRQIMRPATHLEIDNPPTLSQIAQHWDYYYFVLKQATERGAFYLFNVISSSDTFLDRMINTGFNRYTKSRTRSGGRWDDISDGSGIMFTSNERLYRGPSSKSRLEAALQAMEERLNARMDALEKRVDQQMERIEKISSVFKIKTLVLLKFLLVKPKMLSIFLSPSPSPSPSLRFKVLAVFFVMII
ncbi:hypothetical protein KEM48_010477 [Puccinia striiformis f. sp. tritici PST-130]|nr:hypothetical protein KEM48_010477 [Puccinia striiformis f. sp. tritici PST-130]